VICPGCHQEIYVSPDGITECGGEGRGVCAETAAAEARAEWEFLHELVHSLTGHNGYRTIEGLFNQMAAEVPAFAGLEWAKVGDTGVTVQI
jgi:predicted molibdopterin-dependent oxidoreductase YjgC